MATPEDRPSCADDPIARDLFTSGIPSKIPHSVHTATLFVSSPRS